MSLKKSASISRLEQLARVTAAQDPSSGAFETIKGSTRAATANTGTAAANTAVTITYAAAGSGVSHVITGLACSYSAAAAAGKIQVKDGASNVVFDLDLNFPTTGGQQVIVFNPPLKLSTNTALNVVLGAGGSGAVGKVNVLGHYTEA